MAAGRDCVDSLLDFMQRQIGLLMDQSYQFTRVAVDQVEILLGERRPLGSQGGSNFVPAFVDQFALLAARALPVFRLLCHDSLL